MMLRQDRDGHAGWMTGRRVELSTDAPQPPSADHSLATEASDAIEVSHLRKTYGQTVAADDISFSVTDGEIFGLLGPNGAGKTTTVECAIGLRTPDSGRVRILGLDPNSDRERLRQLVGVQLQSAALPAKLKVGEVLDLYASFYQRPADTGQLLGALGLADKRDEDCRSLSGGQQQRLSIAVALVGQPRVAVLDELTTGLDPRARRETWELIEQARNRSVTILLVTHNMEEAQRLCDRVALVDEGRIVAAGTPEQLAQQADARKHVQLVPSEPFDDRLLTALSGVSSVEHHGQRVEVRGTGDLVNAVIQTLAAAGVTAHDVQLTSSTLEDAFIELTGRHLGSAPDPAPQPKPQRRNAPRERRSLLPKDAPRRALLKLAQCEARLAWRQPIGLIFGLAIPILLLAIFGSIPSWREQHQKSLGGLTVLQSYLPVFIVFVLAALALFSLPTPLASYREQGILRRLSTTPVPPAWLLAAQLAINVCIAVTALVVLMAIATVGFGLGAPRSLVGFIVSILLSGLAVFGIGLWISGTARSAAAAGGIAWLTFYPLMFFAGLFVPREVLPAILRHIGDWTPLGAAVDTIGRATQTGFPSASPLLALAGYALVFGTLAVRYFRWE